MEAAITIDAPYKFVIIVGGLIMIISAIGPMYLIYKIFENLRKSEIYMAKGSYYSDLANCDDDKNSALKKLAKAKYFNLRAKAIIDEQSSFVKSKLLFGLFLIIIISGLIMGFIMINTSLGNWEKHIGLPMVNKTLKTP